MARKRNSPRPKLDPRKPITRRDYPSIFGDTDSDRIPDVDDPRPRIPGDTESIEEVRLSDEMDELIATRQRYVPALQAVQDELDDMGVKGSTTKGRVKTPFSMINKLRRKRLPTLTDVAGAMIIVPDQAELERTASEIESRFKVIGREDYYKTPLAGYRALHYVVESQGLPVEIQLKTKRMATIGKASHTAYKRGELDPDAMERVSALAVRADKGDRDAQREVDALLADPSRLRRSLGGMKTNPDLATAARLARGRCR